jgi:hypothetical protein
MIFGKDRFAKYIIPFAVEERNENICQVHQQRPVIPARTNSRRGIHVEAEQNDDTQVLGKSE